MISNYNEKDFNDFVYQKKEINKSNLSISEQAKIINQFYPKIKNTIINSITNNDIIITIPSSTTSSNFFPLIFANKIEEDTQAQYVDTNQYIERLHTRPAKIKLSLTESVNSPINYKLNNIEELKQIINNRKVILVDDINSTGETITRLQKQLNNAGIEVKDKITIVSTENRKVSPTDIFRLTENIAKELPLSYLEKRNLFENTTIVYNDYMRYKFLNDVREYDKLKKEVGNKEAAQEFYDAIKIASNFEIKNFGIKENYIFNIDVLKEINPKENKEFRIKTYFGEAKDIYKECNEIPIKDIITSVGKINKEHTSQRNPVFNVNGENYIITYNRTYTRGSTQTISALDFVKQNLNLFTKINPNNEKQKIFIATEVLRNFIKDNEVKMIPQINKIGETNINEFNPKNLHFKNVNEFTQNDFKYFNDRGIKTETLKNDIFYSSIGKGNYTIEGFKKLFDTKNIYNYDFLNQDKILFKFFDKEGHLKGYEMLDKVSKIMAKNSDKANSIWCSAGFDKGHKVDKIFIGESPNDLLAFHQMYKPENAFYLATGGQTSQNQQNIFTAIIEKLKGGNLLLEGVKLFSCFDNDPQGLKNEAKFFQNLNFEKLLPVQKDFNDDLIKNIIQSVIINKVGGGFIQGLQI